MHTPAKPIIVRLGAFCLLSILTISGIRAAEAVIPSDKVIPKPGIFGAGCVYYEAMMDEVSLAFVNGKPFKFDKFPYTAELDTEKPEFSLSIYYWESAEHARKSFLEGREALSKEGMGVVEPLAKDGSREFYEFNFGGRVHCCSMVVRNVHFVLKDQYQTLGKPKMMEMTKLYAAFLEGPAPATAPGGTVAATAGRKWKNSAGKEIEGTVHGFDPANETVDFVRADGKRFPTLPLKTFSQEDQDFLRKQKP